MADTADSRRWAKISHEDEREIFTQLTGREREPLQRVDQFAAVIGRRGGKSRAIATVATYIAGLCDHTGRVGARGARRPAVRRTRSTGGEDHPRLCRGLFRTRPILRQLIASRTADALELTNCITLEVRPASFRKLRGPTYIAVIADELAFWYVDTAYANPDVEILNAVEPGLATTGGPLILASSPNLRGSAPALFKRHYGAGGDPLILAAQVRPDPQSFGAEARGRSGAGRGTAPARRREYLAQFRTDVEGFVALHNGGSYGTSWRGICGCSNTFPNDLAMVREA